MARPEFDLIVTIVNRGFSDQVMEAAKEAGAHGGTVVLARGTGLEDAEKFFGISITPEKELVLILVREEKRTPVMQAIGHEAGLMTEAGGICFSLPVDEVVGAVRTLRKAGEAQGSVSSDSE
ncbi:MAG: P-II family nitrogen regulator [Christensenellales bacterium]|jgi:nitrogen regulatory protein P-II 1